MRKLLKINFLILVVAAFYLVYRQAFMQRYDKFYYEEGKTILEGNSNIEKYQQNKHLFFYEAKGFHKKEPLLSYSNEDIKIDIYEISFPSHNKADIHNVVTYIMPIITADKSFFSNKDLTYGIYFATETNEDILLEDEEEKTTRWFEIIDFVNLGLYVVDTGYGEVVPIITGEDIDLLNEKPLRIEIFTAMEFLEENIKKIKIDRILTIPFEIDENSFSIRNELINLFHEKESEGKPKEINQDDLDKLEEKGIYFTAFHNASKYNSVLYLWFGSYLAIVLASGYFVFFFRRNNKNLGGEKPTKALKESIKESEEIKEKKKEDKLR